MKQPRYAFYQLIAGTRWYYTGDNSSSTTDINRAVTFTRKQAHNRYWQYRREAPNGVWGYDMVSKGNI